MLRADPIEWLLERDQLNPGVRYFALKDLLARPADDPEVVSAQNAIMASGPVPAILDAQDPEGFWVKRGAGYSPKYRSTTWQIILLAELGAHPSDERVRLGCDYLLNHSIASQGAFSVFNPPVPRGFIHCLSGNLLYALIRLGWATDPRVISALDWHARAVTGEGEIHYFDSTTSGPCFACGENEGKPCAWGANKALKALLVVPESMRTPPIERAIKDGIAFLLSRDPALSDYPFTGRVSSTWFKLGFPLSYWSDVLETAFVVAAAGYGDDPRMADALDFILAKQDALGRWKLENSLNGKMWLDIEKRGRPSKWVTLRALRFLKQAGLY